MTTHHVKKSGSMLALVALVSTILAGAYFYRQDIRQAYAKFKRGPIPAEVIRRVPTMTTDAAVEPTPSVVPEPSAIAEPEISPLPVVEVPDTEPVVPSVVPLEPEDQLTGLPAQYNLKIPFILQAPFRVWDEIHDDACEEASALMVQAYYRGETEPFTPDEMEKRIMAVVDYLVETYGTSLDSDAATTAAFMRDFLGLKNSRVVPFSTPDDLRREIAAGRPVIIPAYGKRLRNPNFRNGGPDYHMLVLKGYRADGAFITHEPGTRFGENYVYDETSIMEAAHDWNGGNVENGARVMILAE